MEHKTPSEKHFARYVLAADFGFWSEELSDIAGYLNVDACYAELVMVPPKAFAQAVAKAIGIGRGAQVADDLQQLGVQYVAFS